MKKNQNSVLKRLSLSRRGRYILLTFLMGVTFYGCHNSTKTLDAGTTDEANKVDTLKITDNVAFNREYVLNQDSFKKKYLGKYAEFEGFYYLKNPFTNQEAFLLRYPPSDRMGSDPIGVLELKFNTPRPHQALVSYQTEVAADNKYWIYDSQSKKTLQEMSSHSADDINEHQPSFYIPKIIEYIDEPSSDTKGYLLGYNDNALQKLFTKYNSLQYKLSDPTDQDYNNHLVLTAIKIKGKIDQINVAGDGTVWIQLSDEKITSVKNTFTIDGLKPIDYSLVKKGSNNVTPDTAVNY
jgi:hypothetical protein